MFDANASLRALEPAARDANAFKARSALIAMRDIVSRARESGTDASIGMRACYSAVSGLLGSGKREVRADAVATARAFVFVDGGLTVDETEERMAFAWKHANWRFRSSAMEILSACAADVEDATDAFAKRLFDRCVEALSDREADVRERAFEGISRAHGRFPDAVRMALEATRDDMRPQHVKEIERRLKSSRGDSGRSDGATVSGKYLHGASENKGAPTATIGDGLVPPPPERISNERELERAIDRIARDLQPNQDWLKRIAAMVRLEAITLGGGADVFEAAFNAALGRAVDVLVAQIGDRRSAVVKQVTHLLVTLAANATKPFEAYVDQFVAALLKTTVVTIGVIADSGNACIRGVITHCRSPKLVSKLTDIVVRERSPKMRACIVDCLTLILQNWDLGKRQIDSIGDALKVTLSDADANVRANSKSCFEILSVTSPTASDNVLARVDSKVAKSLSSMTNDSESEASVDRRDRSSRGDVSSAPSRSASRASGTNNFDKEVQGASKPPTPPSSTVQGVAAAVMFAERVERAAEVATRAEACAKLRNALEEADTRTHGAQVAKFEAQVTSHASRIVELLLGYMSDTDALVIDPALECAATIAYIAAEEIKDAMSDLCLAVFECLSDHRESTRALASEALTAIGDVHKPDALVLPLLRSLHLASTPRIKTGVLEFALYVLCGRGGGAGEAVHSPAKVSDDIESWVDLVIELACDVDEVLAKAAGSNLAAIHSHVDGAIVPRRLMASSEYKRVRFMEAVERRVPKLASMLQPFLSVPSPKPKTPVKAQTPLSVHKEHDAFDDVDEFEDQNNATLNAARETVISKTSAIKLSRPGVGEQIVAAMEGLRDDSVETVIRSLRDVESCARSHHGQFKPYLPLIVPTLCSLVDDSIEFVAAHAFAALKTIFSHGDGDLNDAIAALLPLINAYSSSSAPLYCVQTLLEESGAQDVETVASNLLPPVVFACNNLDPTVRHEAVKVLAMCQRTLGKGLIMPFTADLSPTHRAIVDRYADELA